MPVFHRTYIIFTLHKAFFTFFNITNKSIILSLKVVNSSSKNTNNPPLIYIEYNVNNKYVTFLILSFSFYFYFYIFLELGGNIPTTSTFRGF